jgi:thioredoxin 1
MEYVKELNEKNFNDFIKDKSLSLVDFFADWCMPCIVMSPVVEELAKKFRGKIKFGKINVDENHDLAQKFGVYSIPNFVLFKEGKILDRFVGAMSFEDFQKRLEKHF